MRYQDAAMERLCIKRGIVIAVVAIMILTDGFRCSLAEEVTSTPKSTDLKWNLSWEFFAGISSSDQQLHPELVNTTSNPSNTPTVDPGDAEYFSRYSSKDESPRETLRFPSQKNSSVTLGGKAWQSGLFTPESDTSQSFPSLAKTYQFVQSYPNRNFDKGASNATPKYWMTSASENSQSSLPYFAYIREDAPVGSHVITMKTIASGNSRSHAQYEISAGNELNRFQINPTTGEIFVANNLDREDFENYNLSIRAYDYAGHDCVSPVLIKLIDINDNTPVIQNPNVIFTAPCGISNALVGIMYAIDHDAGRNGQVFYFLQEDPSNIGSFYIDPTSGAIGTATALPPTPSQYTLHIVARDQGADQQLQSMTNVTVYVECRNEVPTNGYYGRHAFGNFARPVCRNEPTFVAVPNGSPVGSLVAVASAVSESGPVVYSLVPSDDTVGFDIDSITGRIVIKNELRKASNSIRWQATDSYNSTCFAELMVQIAQMSSAPTIRPVPPTTTTFAPLIIKSPPQFLSSMYQFMVAQCGQAGIVVGTVVARSSDSTAPGQIKYTTSDPNVHISPDSGVLTLTRPFQAGQQPIKLQVSATDRTGQTSSAVVALIPQCPFQTAPVLLKLAFRQLNYSFTVTCGQPPTDVGKLEVTVAGNDVLFSLVNQSDRFMINNKTGVIQSRGIIPATPEAYNLMVAVTSGGNSVQTGVGIRVACPKHLYPRCPPGPLSANISVNTESPSFVASVRASSPTGNAIVYSIVEPSDAFQINPITGEMKYLPSSMSASGNDIVLQLRATDSLTGLYCQIPIRIYITSTPPVFTKNSFVFNVNCLNANNLIGVVQAMNRNPGINGQLFYSLSGSDAGFFVIGSNSGEIRSAAPTSRPAYYFSVTAKDGAGASAEVPVIITSSCEPPVQCQTSSVVLATNDTLPVGSRIGGVFAAGSGVTYMIISPEARDKFSVNLTSGFLTSLKTERSTSANVGTFEMRTENFIVRASDSRQNYCDINVFVTTNVTASSPPAFLNSTYRFNLPCSPSESFVGIVQARNVDGGASQLMYDISGLDSAFFSIDRFTGEIRSRSNQLDQRPYVITAGVVDLGTRLRAQVDIRIIVSCAPLICPPDVSTITFPEDAPVGSIVGALPLASRPVVYQVISSSIPGVLINPDSGQISVSQPMINNEASSVPFFVVISAVDMYGQSCNIRLQVTVMRKRSPPEFIGKPYTFRIPACSGAGYSVGRITAVASSTASQNGISYKIVAGNTLVFSINKVSGDLQLTSAPAPGSYQLQITAIDLSTTNATTTAEIRIPECPLECPSIIRADVPDNAVFGTPITRLSVGERTTYQLVSGNGTLPIKLNFISGLLTVDGSFRGLGDRTFQILSSAQAENGRNCQIVIEIHVIAQKPVCPLAMTANVLQNVSVGTLLTRVSVGESGAFLYTIIDTVNAAGFFEIDRAGGALIVAKSLRNLPARTYAVVVRASAVDHPTQFCDVTIAVDVQPTVISPICSNQPVVVTLPASGVTSIGDAVTRVKASSPSGSALIYSIGSSFSNFLTIDPGSGIVTLAPGFLNVSSGSYTVEIRASDPSGAFCDTTLLVNIPVPNRPPTFSYSQYQFKVTCAPSNSAVGDVIAIDTEGSPIQLALSESTFFELDQAGRIKTKVAISSPIPVQRLIVTAKDGAGLTSTAIVFVTFDPSRCPVPPTCPPTSPSFDLMSDAPVGSVIGQISGINSNGRDVRYEISGDKSGNFAVDPNSGQIRLLQQLSRSTAVYLQLTVRAITADSLYCEVSVQIRVTTAQVPPKFSQSAYVANISCGAQLKCFGNVVAAAQNGNALFSVAPNESSIIVNRNTGLVCFPNASVSSRVSRTATVIATDPVNQLTAMVSVILNFEPCPTSPVCPPKPLSAAISENDQIGTAVLQVSASDPDVRDVLSYAIVNGNQLNHFSVGQQSGIIMVNGALDRETVPAYKLTVVARDSFNLTCQVIVDVDVIDTNDNIPKFQNSSYNFIAECQTPFALLGVISASDADIGLNSRITYSVAPNSTIAIDGDTGETRTRFPLDNGVYVVDVFAADAGSPQRSSRVPVTVTVSNCGRIPPICPVVPDIQLAENSPRGSFVLNILAMNPGGNGVLRYSLSGAGSDKLSIANSGRLSVAGPLDRELTPSFNLTVKAVNEAGLACNSSFRIILTDENDHPPSFVGDLNFAVNCGVANASVGFVLAKDADKGVNSALEYSLSSNREFTIDRKTGEIRTAVALSGQPSIREVTVQVSDLGLIRRVTQALVRVNVLQNCAPVLRCQESYSSQIREDSGIGSEPSSSSYIDQAALVFSIIKGNEEGLFSIKQTNGKISVAKRLSAGVFDLAVEARIASLACTSQISITVMDIDDNAPLFLQKNYSFTVACGSMGIIGKTHASDSDQGLNGAVSYTISGSNRFIVDARTGEIRATDPLEVVTASDSGVPPRSATASVTVVAVCMTTPSPYHPPVCPTNIVAEVQENQNGLVIANVVAEETSGNTHLRYQLLRGSDFGPFQLEEGSGRLMVTFPLDREMQSTYLLTVRAINRNDQYCDTNVQINVIDMNDNSPMFSQTNYEFDVNCMGYPPFQVGLIKASDLDFGQNAAVIYHLENDGFLTINPESGEILLLTRLPPGIPGTVTLLATAVNLAYPQPKTAVSVQISLGPECYLYT